MSEVKLIAESRTEFGKGAARRLRRAHKVPAVLYGHGSEPIHVALDGHDTMMALKASNALLTIEMAGKSELALPKDVQRDPLKGFIEHVDLLIVKRGEKVTVDVPVQVVGEPTGALAMLELTALTIEVEATHIPQHIEIDVAGAEAGTQVHAGQVALPAGTVLVTDSEALVVNVTARAAAAAEAAEEGEAAEAAEEAEA